MQRILLMLVLAAGLWPLLAAAVTRDNFLLRNTQDLVELCSVQEQDPLRDAAIAFCHGFGAIASNAGLAAAIGAGAGLLGGFLYGELEDSKKAAYEEGYRAGQMSR